jgi:hypothetical protein
MKAEELYEKEFGDAESVSKESVIRLLKHFAKVLKIEREQIHNGRSKQYDCEFGRCEQKCEKQCDWMENKNQ